MEKVEFTFNRGFKRTLTVRQAELLAKVGLGQYQTRSMAQQPVIVKPMVAAQVSEPDLDAMDKEQLHALAKERGVKVHPLSGADKVRAALRE